MERQIPKSGIDVVFEQIFIEFPGSDRQIETMIEPLVGVVFDRGFLRGGTHHCVAFQICFDD